MFLRCFYYLSMPTPCSVYVCTCKTLLCKHILFIVLIFFSEHNAPASAKIIGRVLREHHEYLIAYIEGAGVIPITNHLFSSEIITEYMYKCVTQNPYTQHASIVALECRLYVTLDHNPEGKLDILLNVFMKVESVGPDVASMIRKVSTI